MPGEVKLTKGPWNDPTVRWVCEDHPTRDQEHRLFPWFWKRCGGAGMPALSQPASAPSTES